MVSTMLLVSPHPPAEPPVVVAFGAGVDSTAMLLEMVAQGRRIDLVLFADTGSEKPETYVPRKSACFMCGAAKPWEIRDLPISQLRRIVLMEARAKPRLRNVEGLWRKSVKGRNGAERRPGAMTDFIRDEQLLPSDEIDAIIAMAPAALVRFQDAEGNFPVEKRAELSAWLKWFDANDRRLFDDPGGLRFYDGFPAPIIRSELQAAA